MPLDQFISQSAHLRDYGEALIERECYAEAGIDWPVPWQPAEEPSRGDSWSAGGQRLFDEELASQYGYHTARKSYDGLEEWQEFVATTSDIATSTPGFQSYMDKCQGESKEALPQISEDAIYYADEAAYATLQEALVAPEVVATHDLWQQCMSDAGYAGLGAMTPGAMPPDDLAERWQIGDPYSEPQSEEIAMAMADAKCGESSGWAATLYAAAWDTQKQFLEANSDKLLRIRDELDAERVALLESIASHAPAR